MVWNGYLGVGRGWRFKRISKSLDGVNGMVIAGDAAVMFDVVENSAFRPQIRSYVLSLVRMFTPFTWACTLRAMRMNPPPS